MTNGEIRPNPDPTIATHSSIERAAKAERDYTDSRIAVLEERLAGIDRATTLLSTTENVMPDDLSMAVKHLRDLTREEHDSIQMQFKERDTRQERESKDNKTAVDAAFAAQKEAVTKQDEANGKAIDKSETATKEKIDKLAELFRTEMVGLSARSDDLKERIATLDRRLSEIGAARAGAVEQSSNSRDSRSDLYAAAAFIALIFGTLVALGAFS